MSKGLEELDIIKENHLQLTKEKYRKLDTKAIDTILNNRLKHYKIIEKELIALEIIKKYRLIIYNEIEDAIATKGYVHNLPQDVVDLLKEVLL